MRVLPGLVLVTLGLTTTASADRYYEGSVAQPPADKELWKEIAEPHAEEVRMVLDKIQQAMDLVNSFNAGDTDPDGALRGKLLDDARGMAKYLRRLVPDNSEVLLMLGRVSDESGRADEAREAFLEYMELEAAAPAYEATLRLGRIYLRLGEFDEAIRYLRQANMTGSYYNNYAPIYLASALTGAGRDEEALDVLEASAAGPGSSWGGEPQMPLFALAVAYDRDEQISEAFAAIDRLQNSLQGGYLGSMQSAISSFVPVPAGEAHYYRALLYESSGFLDEARSSWVLYAQSGENARYRERALSHVAAIDVLIDKTIASRKPGKKGAAAAITITSPYGGYGGQYGYGGGYGQPYYGGGGYGYGGSYVAPPPPATTKAIKKHKKKKKKSKGNKSP